MNEIQILKNEMIVCEGHKERLLLAIEKLSFSVPFTKDYLEKLSDNDLAYMELLTSRFGKLQDTLGRKIIPIMLSLLNEDRPTFTFMDRLLKIEKMGLIKSAQDWILLRELRNSIAHDYPDETDRCEALNKCFKLSKDLINYWEKFKKHIELNILPFYKNTEGF